MKFFLVAIFFTLWSCLSSATPTTIVVRTEIDALLLRLQLSGCQFDRNGAWYSASEAKDHLLGKLEYAVGSKSTIQTTEQFIALTATKSSFSGIPYHVKCGMEEIVESQEWLNKQLVILRALNIKGKP